MSTMIHRSRQVDEPGPNQGQDHDHTTEVQKTRPPTCVPESVGEELATAEDEDERPVCKKRTRAGQSKSFERRVMSGSRVTQSPGPDEGV